MIRWLLHWLGLDDPSGAQYLFWSGFFPSLSIFAVPVTMLRRHNCHAPGCHRIGRFHAADGSAFCHRHAQLKEGQ